MADETPDFHNVTLSVLEVRDGQIARDPHQTIRAIVNIKMPPEQARLMLEKLQNQLDGYFEGMDVITLTLEGEFT